MDPSISLKDPRDLGQGATIDRWEGVYFGVGAADDDAPPLALFATEAEAWAWVKQQQEAGELCMDVDVTMVAARCEVWNAYRPPERDRLMALLGQETPR